MTGEEKTNLPQQRPAPLADSPGWQWLVAAGTEWWQAGFLLAPSSLAHAAHVFLLPTEAMQCCLAARTSQACGRFGELFPFSGRSPPIAMGQGSPGVQMKLLWWSLQHSGGLGTTGREMQPHF